MGLFSSKESEEFARRLAGELATRVPPSLAKADLDRAMKFLIARGRDYRKSNKVSVLKQIGLSRAFQDALGAKGYADEFIREATLTLARAMREKEQ